MIKSMTGYGKAVAVLENGKLTIEIRSVNGKNADIGIKTGILPRDRELELRRRLAERLERGSIDFFATWEAGAGDGAKAINIPLAKEYYRQINELGSGIGAMDLNVSPDRNYLISTILRMPDVIDDGKREIVTEENWPIVSGAIDEAIDAVDAYRRTEGEALYRDVISRVHKILAIYGEVDTFASERVSATRERILKAAEDMKVKLDPERFEQEMIFYLEKLDINEEKVRLLQHCRYFMDTIDGESAPGKKLGFILQEMGREINTTGSKANHAGIQKCVVMMKDELEKIREQAMNIL